MQFSSVLLALAAATVASAGAVTSAITPPGTAPAGCSSSYSGQFEITIVRPNAKREVEVEKRDACAGTGTLVISLENGILTDAAGRTGYIASNYQFQFDKPPQAGAIYTAGFSVCGNSSIALGDTTVFYQCQSGNFYNLYNTDWAPQCQNVAIDIVPCGGAVAPSAPAATASGASAPAATTPATTPAAGSPATTSAIPVSQYTDGQPQVPSALVSQITDGQPQAPSAKPAPTIAQGAGAIVGVAQGAVLAAAGLVGAALL